MSRFGVNVIGFASARLGLGVAARATIAALVRSNIPTAVVDVTLPDGRSGFDQTWSHLFVGDTAAPLPHPVTIVHVNPAEAQMVRAQIPVWFAGTYNTIVPFFELNQIPAAWIGPLSTFDMILAASSHIGSAITQACNTPVRRYEMGIDASPAQLGREHFGLPGGRFIFATTFDTDSGLNRKNGFGVIRAFEHAFGGAPGAGPMLAVKLNGIAQPAPEVKAAFDRLSAAGRAKIFDQYLPYPDVLSLYRSCDAFVSLHRAEGLGLGLMEAMSFGKPVVATGWSGNMDFMDETNAAIVPYSLTPVIDTQPEYSRDRLQGLTHWAEPDLMQAAALMRRLVDDAEYRERIAGKAQADIAARNARFFSGESFRVLEAAYEAFGATK